jgi:hypothetical protein
MAKSAVAFTFKPNSDVLPMDAKAQKKLNFSVKVNFSFDVAIFAFCL